MLIRINHKCAQCGEKWVLDEGDLCSDECRAAAEVREALDGRREVVEEAHVFRVGPGAMDKVTMWVDELTKKRK